MNNKYFIKDNYIENEKATTFDIAPSNNYWNNERIQTAKLFQYYVYKFARKLIKDKNLSSFLDIGCGPAIKVKEFIEPYCEKIILFDQPNSKVAALKNVPSAQFYGFDFEKDNININQEFDLVICADVIEHMLDPDRCIKLIRSHMSLKSILIISTPERDNLRGIECNHFTHPSHIREWNKNEFYNYISDRGFKIIKHITLPQKKLITIESILYGLLDKFLKKRTWNNCQVILCKRAY